MLKDRKQLHQTWKPVEGKITTRWAQTIDPDRVWEEYPRPGLQRPEWLNLNGLWEYAITGEEKEWTGGRVENAEDDRLLEGDAIQPDQWDGSILVPFCIESSLSGVGKLVRPNQLLWYRRSFSVPNRWKGQRLLLHFEAVDWHCIVWVNGVKVGEHKGAFAPFTMDITDALRSGDQEIVAAVWDPSNAGDQALGKQVLPELRHGFRYTPTTGIWQTVWAEPVPDTSIERVKLTPNLDESLMHIECFLRGDSRDCKWTAELYDEGKLVAAVTGSASQPLQVAVTDPKRWEPDSPFLYDVKIKLTYQDKILDEVTSYCGFRKIDIAKDEQGTMRIRLNNQPVFQYGPLDQGYWPEGLQTPPSEEAMLFDLQYLKNIGCNMVRVHMKVHPARWYHLCDRLGLLVWQDMVSTWLLDAKITAESAQQWEFEWKEMIDHLYHYPSIIQWIVFNESWGQYDTERITDWTMKQDPSRLVTGASGWTDVEIGHVHDTHDYSFHPAVPAMGIFQDRAVVLGECGGFDLLLPGHIWHEGQSLPLKNDDVIEIERECYADPEEFEARYTQWLEQVLLLKNHGLCAAVYTQLSDIEHEANGWLTYDREVSKIEIATLKHMHDRLRLEVNNDWQPLLPEDHEWTYHMTDHPDEKRKGLAPFRSPNAALPIHTIWEGHETISMKSTFELKQIPRQLIIRLMTSGHVDVFLNGELIKQTLYNTSVPVIQVTDMLLSEATRNLLRCGQNELLVSGRKEEELCYLDVQLLTKK